MYVISAKISPHIPTTDARPLDGYRYWSGGTRWSTSPLAAARFTTHANAQAQVDHMNLREYAITAIGDN